MGFDLCKRSMAVKARFGLNSATGAAVAADSLPSGRLIIDDVVNAATATVTANATGDYTASVTIPADATIGGRAEVQVAATVATVAGPYVTVWAGRIVPAMVYDSLVAGSDYLESDVTQWKGATAPAMTGDAFARLGSPSQGSVIADLALVASNIQSWIAAVTAQTNKLTFNGDNDVIASLGTESVTLTAPAQAALVQALEAELANDATGEALRQAISDKIIENLPDLDDLTLTAIASSAAAAILATPANKLATNASGQVVASNMRGTDNALLAANYVSPDNTSAAAAAATAAKLDTALELDGSVYRLTANALEQAPAGEGGGSGASAADVAAAVEATTTLREIRGAVAGPRDIDPETGLYRIKEVGTDTVLAELTVTDTEVTRA
jgi:hypothetical protein